MILKYCIVKTTPLIQIDLCMFGSSLKSLSFVGYGKFEVYFFNIIVHSVYNSISNIITADKFLFPKVDLPI